MPCCRLEVITRVSSLRQSFWCLSGANEGLPRMSTQEKRTKTSFFATNARKRVFSFTWQRCHANYRDDSAIPGGRDSVLSHRRRETISTRGGGCLGGRMGQANSDNGLRCPRSWALAPFTHYRNNDGCGGTEVNLAQTGHFPFNQVVFVTKP